MPISYLSVGYLTKMFLYKLLAILIYNKMSYFIGEILIC